MGLDNFFTPPVQGILLLHIGSHGRYAAAWRHVGVRVEHPAIRLQKTCIPPLPDETEQGQVIRAPSPHWQQSVMVQMVENAVDAGLHLPIHTARMAG
jgi:hypothetical protein